MIYIIDHQDSFTWNVVHQFLKFDKVYCSNYFNINKKKLDQSNTIILSPGPGSPTQRGSKAKTGNPYSRPGKQCFFCQGLRAFPQELQTLTKGLRSKQNEFVYAKQSQASEISKHFPRWRSYSVFFR